MRAVPSFALAQVLDQAARGVLFLDRAVGA
jgi:hypothetical protein